MVVVDLFVGECVGGDLCPSGDEFDVGADHGDGFSAPSAADVKAA